MLQRLNHENEHLDYYILMTLIKQQQGISNIQLSNIMSEKLGVPFSLQDVENATMGNNAPKTYDLVRRMKELGYSPGFISEYLGVSKQSVSYHLGRIQNSAYVNPYIHAIQHARTQTVYNQD